MFGIVINCGRPSSTAISLYRDLGAPLGLIETVDKYFAFTLQNFTRLLRTIVFLGGER